MHYKSTDMLNSRAFRAVKSIDESLYLKVILDIRF